MSEETFGLTQPNDEITKNERGPSTKRVTRSRTQSARDHTAPTATSGWNRRWSASDVERQDWTEELTKDQRFASIDLPGFAVRVIRTKKAGDSGEDDVKNITAAQNAGWEPITPDMLPPGVNLPTMEMSGGITAVGVSGSLYCRMPKTLYEQIKAGYNKRSRDAMAAIPEGFVTHARNGGARAKVDIKTSRERGTKPPSVQGD